MVVSIVCSLVTQQCKRKTMNNSVIDTDGWMRDISHCDASLMTKLVIATIHMVVIDPPLQNRVQEHGILV